MFFVSRVSDALGLLPVLKNRTQTVCWKTLSCQMAKPVISFSSFCYKKREG